MQANPIVILTREQGDNVPLLNRLQQAGIEVLSYPCIETTLLPYEETCLPVGRHPEYFQVIIFTSKRGVAGTAPVHARIARSSQLIAVVGETTANAVREAIGREPGIIADPSTAASLARQLTAVLNPGDRVLYVRGNKSMGILQEVLTAKGFSVTEQVVYQNKMPELKPLPSFEKGIVLFAGPSAVDCFFYYNPIPPGRLLYLAIGTTTAEYLNELGLTGIFQLEGTDIDSIMNQIQGLIQGGFSHE